MRTQEALAIVSALVWLSGAAPTFAQGNTHELLAQANPQQTDPSPPPSERKRSGTDQNVIHRNRSNSGNAPAPEDSLHMQYQGILVHPN